MKKKVLKKVIVSVTSDLFTDQRVNRTSTLLHDLGFEVILVGRKKRTSSLLADRIYKTKQFKLLFEKGFLFYACYNLRLFTYLLFHKCNLLVSNDLDTLLPNYLISRLKGISLIYDSHEYFTGVPEIQQRPFVKKVWTGIEKMIFPHLKHIFTVNNSIANLYREEYGKELIVIRNIPEIGIIGEIKSRTALGLPEDKQIVLMQGAGINVDRGGEEAVLSMLPQYGLQNVVLYIIGDGDVVAFLKKMVTDNNLETLVFFLPRKPYNELVNYTVNADIGLTLDKDTNINYRYSLPNKIFDYIHAQIPVLASPLVEVKNIVEKYQIGVLIENFEPQHIANKINDMLNDKKKIDFWKKNLKIASQKLTWENEKKELINVFKQYL